MQSEFTLAVGFLDRLVAELDGEDVVGIILGGSHARGTAAALSDVDIALFVRDDAALRPKRYFYRDGLLASCGTKTAARVRADAADPSKAVWVVPGILEAAILLDKDGSLRNLMQDLARFDWAPLRRKANRHVSNLMMGLTEPVHKLANELHRGNEAGVAHVLPLVLAALTEAVAVYLGVLVQSDSTYFRQVQEAAGSNSEWAACHRRAAGLTGATLVERAKACLLLHRLTFQMVQAGMDAEQARVVEEANSRVAFVYE
jgi:hypothetical protein